MTAPNTGARRSRWAERGLALAVVLTVLGTAAGSARATFPGRNGQIAYLWMGESNYRAGATATSVRTVDQRGSRVRVLRDCPLLELGYTECTVGAPSYSPDGRTIALLTIRVVPDLTWQGPWQYLPGVATMAADGTGYEEHPTADIRWTALAWSPAGDRFLLQRFLTVPDYNKPTAIFLASLDGTELSQIAPAWSAEPDWSSTGSIAFTRTRTGPSCALACLNIWVTRPGGTPRKVTYRGGFSPSWSPHATKLAFVRNDQSQRGIATQDVYVVGRDGRGLRRLTRRGGSNPAWSPDGKWIAFTRAGDLYVVGTTGRGLRRVVNAPPPSDGWKGGAVISVDWQPLPHRQR